MNTVFSSLVLPLPNFDCQTSDVLTSIWLNMASSRFTSRVFPPRAGFGLHNHCASFILDSQLCRLFHRLSSGFCPPAVFPQLSFIVD